MERLLAHRNQDLARHLLQVGERASLFAAAFDAAAHALVAGQLHDLGKAEVEFQRRIRTEDREGDKEPHAHHGAAFALASNPPSWLVAFAVNGHHAGLHDRSDVEKRRGSYLTRAATCLDELRQSDPQFSPVFPEVLPAWLAGLSFDPAKTSDAWLAADLFTRMLFSALVDADRLDAEESELGKEASFAARKWPDFEPEALLRTLREELARRSERARAEGTASAAVSAVRNEVGELCMQAAASPRGLFSLTVPTGGGKTLASVLFALAHAAFHRGDSSGTRPLRRIIVVLPYLSIIQQTAQELRRVFGDGWILEHHSQTEEADASSHRKEPEDGKADDLSCKRRLAVENWDAPIVVTTSVQFFGSLFSRRPSAARKLHNICQSVVLFDEVQTLPPLLLRPLLSVLGELAHPARPYGCSLVFCTATQPALDQSEDLPCGLTGVRPIVPPDVAGRHFRSLSRVAYSWPSDEEGLSWDELASRLVGLRPEQALIVVNTRLAARELHAAIERAQGGSRDGLFHLSTWMTPAHRLEVLAEVRRRLSPDRAAPHRDRCILVSTQCIEAGVDVDFPHVWREFGPYDAIVQAAGRCNRNGRLPLWPGDPSRGQVRVFKVAEPRLPGSLYKTAVSQTELLRRLNLADPDDPASFTSYFRLLYQLSVPDECAIQRERAQLHFQQVSERFKFIDDEGFSVLVSRQTVDGEVRDTPAHAVYRQAEARGFFVREDWRSLQPYLINLPLLAKHRSPCKENLLVCFDPGCGLLLWAGGYSGGLSGIGLTFEGLSPEECIV